VYTTPRKGTTARKAMPLKAYVVDWLKPGNPPTTPSHSDNSQSCRSCHKTANASAPNKPLIMAGCIEGSAP